MRRRHTTTRGFKMNPLIVRDGETFGHYLGRMIDTFSNQGLFENYYYIKEGLYYIRYRDRNLYISESILYLW